jgi:membrane-bound serine protease (ClpP class)
MGGPLLRLGFAVALAVVGCVALGRFLPRLPWTRSLEQATVRGAGFDAVPTAGANQVRVGEEGAAITHLRPAGTARFGDRRIDVVSDGAFVPPGATIRVVRVEGIRVVVAAA